MSIDQLETGSYGNRTHLHAPPEQLRIVSWNIARGSQFDLIFEFLAKADADLILLQEVDNNCVRTSHRNVARGLSQKLGMTYVSGVEFQELAEGSERSPGFHGQATLCRWELSNARVLRFARQSNFWRPRPWIPRAPLFQRRIGGRMALVTEIAMGTRTAVAFNVHLESRNGDDLRIAQLSEVLDEVRRFQGGIQAIIGGDFNFDVHKSGTRHLREAALEAPLTLRTPTTAPSLTSRPKPLDAIVFGGGVWQSLHAEVHAGVPGSDHYPLSLTLGLQQKCTESHVERPAPLQF